MNHPQSKILHQVLAEKKKLTLPTNILALLHAFEVAINDPKSASLPFFINTNIQLFHIPRELQQAFQRMNKTEQIYHYSYHVSFLKHLLNTSANNPTNSPSRETHKNNNLEPLKVKAIAKTGTLDHEKTTIVVNFQDRTLSLISDKPNQVKINIGKYYMRFGKNNNTLLLEAIVPNVPPELKTIELEVKDSHIQQLKVKIQNIIFQILKQKLREDLQNFNNNEKKNQSSTISRELSCLNSTLLSQFKQFSQQMDSYKSQIEGTKELYNSSHKKIFRKDNVYHLDELFLMEKQKLIEGFRLPAVFWNNFVTESILLEDEPYEVLFERYQLDGEIFEYVFIREDKSTLQQGRILIKCLPNFQGKELTMSKFEHAYIRVLKLGANISRLLVDLKVDASLPSQIVISYLMQFSNICQATKKQQKSGKITRKKSLREEISINTTVYYNALGSQQFFDGFEGNYSSSEILQNSTSNVTGSKKLDQNSMDIPLSQQYIHHKYVINSVSQQPQIKKQFSLFSEWKRSENGSLIDTNTEIVTRYKKAIQNILKTFGNSILKDKNIFSISLPINNYAKMSHLQVLANSCGYAPKLIEPYAKSSPVVRTQYLVVFSITVGISNLLHQKPFPAVLGETYQGTINKCPIYLEQISTNPYITRYLFKGLGYKMYGAVQPQLQLIGLNCGKSYSERLNVVQYQDGSKVFMSFPSLNFKGFLFGQRQTWIQCKNFIYDTKNSIFASISYGPRMQQKSKSKTNEPLDYVYGSICEVLPSFLVYFLSHKNGVFPSEQYIVREFCSFEGLWTKQIFMDGKLWFNFQQQCPDKVQYMASELESDSSVRVDLLRHQNNQSQQAQKLKQEIQEQERRDSELRLGYGMQDKYPY